MAKRRGGINLKLEDLAAAAFFPSTAQMILDPPRELAGCRQRAGRE
jgi:hypothetical protein